MWCIFTAKCLNNISKTKQQFLYLTITRDPPNFTTTKLNISNFKTELWPNTDVVCLKINIFLISIILFSVSHNYSYKCKHGTNRRFCCKCVCKIYQ